MPSSLYYKLDLEPESIWLTVSHSQSIKSSILHVQELGDFIAKREYYTKREGLASYLIKYTLSGEGVLEYGGQLHKLEPNQLFWIDCQEPQYYYTSPELENWRVLWVHFYGPTSMAYYEIFQIQNKGSPVITMPPSNHISQALRALLSLYDGTDSTPALDVYASEFLMQIMVDIIKNTAVQRQWLKIPDCVQQARSYLVEHYDQKITLADLAQKYAVSKFYFQKQFKHYIGYTPYEYLLTVRLNRAKEYLRTTDNPVSQIACDVGIPNVGHFINLFKEQEGVTPTMYRKTWF